MSYRETLQSVDTMRALECLGIYARIPQGSYIKFPCPSGECDELAVIKVHGDKKNLFHCPRCKLSGHIISLVMKEKGLDWQRACDWLKEIRATPHVIQHKLELKYELQYHKYLEDKGLSKEICEMFEIGVPKGKTMLAGCVAFTIYNDDMERIAYYGINLKTGKQVFHKSFNPELYLYGYTFYLNSEEGRFIDEVHFTTDIFECVRIYAEDEFAVCNFGLPYISNEQMDKLDNVPNVNFKIPQELVRDFAIRLAEHKAGFHRFD
jgi:hypothetical protein